LGFQGTFLVQHWLGNMGMPRRYPDYLPTDGFTFLNTFSTIFSFVLGASMLVFVWNAVRSWRYGEVTTADDPWGYGNSLEWATSSPPPRHNFTALPRIRSERPAFDLHHPWLAERLILEAPHSPKRNWKPVTQEEIDAYLSAYAAAPRLDG
jgi:cytochrome c oxidase subunit 1